MEKAIIEAELMDILDYILKLSAAGIAGFVIGSFVGEVVSNKFSKVHKVEH